MCEYLTLPTLNQCVRVWSHVTSLTTVWHMTNHSNKWHGRSLWFGHKVYFLFQIFSTAYISLSAEKKTLHAVRFLTLDWIMVETQERFPFGFLLEYLFTLVGLLLFLLDIALDIWTVVSFYQDGAYVYMAVMVFLLLGSSVLLQVFSWLWYSDSLDKIETNVEKFADRHLLIKPFHFLQLGVHLRSVTDLLLYFSTL